MPPTLADLMHTLLRIHASPDWPEAAILLAAVLQTFDVPAPVLIMEIGGQGTAREQE